MAVDHALTTSDCQRNITISNAVKVFSFTGLEKADALASTQDVYWQYGDKSSGGLDATKAQIIKAGMLMAIPKDPSVKGGTAWIVSFIRASADTVLCVTGHNEGVGRAF